MSCCHCRFHGKATPHPGLNKAKREEGLGVIVVTSHHLKCITNKRETQIE